MRTVTCVVLGLACEKRKGRRRRWSYCPAVKCCRFVCVCVCVWGGGGDNGDVFSSQCGEGMESYRCGGGGGATLNFSSYVGSGPACRPERTYV